MKVRKKNFRLKMDSRNADNLYPATLATVGIFPLEQGWDGEVIGNDFGVHACRKCCATPCDVITPV